MEQLVSVIIPVYNAAEYIEECLDSIIAQTYDKLEIIIIDDGSTDNSVDIIRKYVQTDKRIVTAFQKNSGVSVARNNGLKIANGYYICFIDSDDFIDKDYIEILVNNIGQYDCLSCGRKVVSSDSKKILSIENSFNFTVNGKQEILDEYMKSPIFRQSFFGPWCKLYLTSIAKTIEFDKDLKFGEDIVYNIGYLKEVTSIKTIDYCGYSLRKNMDSVTNASSRSYRDRAEHGYTLISDKIENARRDLGVSEEWLQNSKKKGIPLLYFKEVTNLFSSGTPYSFCEAVEKIRLIHNDKPFIQTIREKSFKNLSTAERISKLCVTINNPFCVALIIKLVLAFMN